jgi:hypothetical protein
MARLKNFGNSSRNRPAAIDRCNTRYSNLARNLETLRRLRNQADYDEARALTQAQAVAAVQRADGIIQVPGAVRQEPGPPLDRGRIGAVQIAPAGAVHAVRSSSSTDVSSCRPLSPVKVLDASKR